MIFFLSFHWYAIIRLTNPIKFVISINKGLWQKKNEAKKFILLIINGREDTWKESRTNVIKITKQHWWINWICWMFSRFARLRLNVIRSPYITNVCFFVFFWVDRKIFFSWKHQLIAICFELELSVIFLSII